MNNAIKLSELTALIKQIFAEDPIESWVIGEITDCRKNQTGHYYFTLIEKNTSGGIAAKLDCKLWKSSSFRIMPEFRRLTQRDLSDGMKIMVHLKVDFHELYGFSGTIDGIDPAFTIGEIELQRQETIRQLTEDGVIDMNKQLPQPTVIQHIAVISSNTAAGYGDFCNQLHNNPYGYQYHTELFTAIVQGDQAESSIIAALDTIAQRLDEFQVVALIRGGGSKTDLACFDNYNLAFNLAQFPLPIITGIGHERDNSIADIVANQREKTPTAVAEFLINHNAQFDARLDLLKIRIKDIYINSLNTQKRKLDHYQTFLKAYPKNWLKHKKDKVNIAQMRLKQAYLSRLSRYNDKLTFFEKHLKALDPRRFLSLGYTITLVNGKRINANNVKKGDKLRTITQTGEIISTVD